MRNFQRIIMENMDKFENYVQNVTSFETNRFSIFKY